MSCNAETVFPLGERIEHIEGLRRGVKLLLVWIIGTFVTVFIFRVSRYLLFLMEFYEKGIEAEGSPSLQYVEIGILFALECVFVWSVFCLSRHSVSDNDDPSAMRVTLWARILAIAFFVLEVLMIYGDLKLVIGVEISDGRPLWLDCYTVLGFAKWLALTAAIVLALLCLGQLRAISGASRLFTVNVVLIWTVLTIRLFGLGSGIYRTILICNAPSPQTEQFSESFALIQILWYVSGGAYLAVLVFAVVVLILFLKLIGRTHKQTLFNALQESR